MTTTPGAPGRPSIIFVMSDDHAAHAISAYGSVVNRTPHIDRLADEGARLDAAYCTNSICTPSRASILTGTYSHINGACSIYSQFDYRVPTFVQVLQQAGYRTALFGKWHLGTAEKSEPQGMDAWKIFPDQGQYVDPVMYGPDGEEKVTGYATDIVTDLSVDFLDHVADDEPFCLLVHHKAPHRPWVPHPRYGHLYTEGTIPEPKTMWDDHASMSTVVQEARMTLDDLTPADVKESVPSELEGEDKLRERSSWKYQRYMRDYLRTVQAVDDSVGTLLDWVDSHGRRDDTVVIYTSDQGFFLGDHGWFDKRLMFDESLTMPLLVRWPAAIEAGQQVDSIITNVDFAATFLDMCGFEPEALPEQQGRSFLPHLLGQSVEDWPESMYYRYWEHDDPEHHAPAHYGVRTRRYKYIHYYNDGLGTPGSSDRVLPSEYELYDLEKDPSELRNVADDLAYAEVREEMEAELARLQEKYRDQPYQGPDTPRLDWAV